MRKIILGSLERMTRIDSSSLGRDRSQTWCTKPMKMMARKGILILLGLVSLVIIVSEDRQIQSIQESRSQSIVVSDSNDMYSAARIASSPQHQHAPPMQPQTPNEPHAMQNQSQQEVMATKHYEANPFALSPGELPGYTGWARPEQTLAGYFDIIALSHPPNHHRMKHHSITNSGDMFSLLLTCNHNRTNGTENDDETEVDVPPYECPPDGGALFYVRAYGPSVITGIVTDFHNSSYSVELQFIDPGEYTLEVVVTFSLPMEYHEFPVDEDIVEPGYEGYMVSGFPLSILVEESSFATSSSDERKSWCTLSQLTESSPTSALYKGHWRVADHVARSSHQPLTTDETVVSIDGYRMGLNSIGVRMTYDFEECELIHIRDLVGAIYRGMDSCLQAQLEFRFHGDRGDSGLIDEDDSDSDTGNVIDSIIAATRRRLAELGSTHSDAGDINATNITENTTRLGLSGLRGSGSEASNINATIIVANRTQNSPSEKRMSSNETDDGIDATNGPIDRAREIANEIKQETNINEDDDFEGIHVIFIGDSVMKLVMSFFCKLVERTSGIKVTFIETNGGIRKTINNVTFALEEIQQREESRNVKRAIIFNSGLHDIDVLCSSKRSHTRRAQNVIKDGESCTDAYRSAMTDLIHVLDEYPAELKVFRSTTAGKGHSTHFYYH